MCKKQTEGKTHYTFFSKHFKTIIFATWEYENKHFGHGMQYYSLLEFISWLDLECCGPFTTQGYYELIVF